MAEPVLVCVGNLTIDVAISASGVEVESVGGDALFAALGARVAGGAPRVLAPLGSDAPPALTTALRAAGTESSGLPLRAEPTVRNIVRYAADGSRSWDLLLGEDHFETLSVHPDDVPGWALAADGVLLSAMGLEAQLALAGWLRPRTDAVVYFDPQEDYVTGNEVALLRAVAACDVFLPSEVEAVRLAGTTDLDAAIRLFLDAGPDVVVVKRAQAGCLVATTDAPDAIPVPVDPIEPVDSTGAGDAFCGAFAAEHLRSGDPVAAAHAGAAAARIAVGGDGIRALVDAIADRPVGVDVR